MLRNQNTYTRNLVDVEKNELTSEQLLLKVVGVDDILKPQLGLQVASYKWQVWLSPPALRNIIIQNVLKETNREGSLVEFLWWITSKSLSKSFVPPTSTQQTQKNQPSYLHCWVPPQKNHQNHLTKFAIPRVAKALRGRTGRHMGCCWKSFWSWKNTSQCLENIGKYRFL